ncbi:MAG: hypothetical protein AAGA56_03150 [Myxococcota bacterium]
MGYQALSILTGGYRYPSCALEYDELFSLMAEGVIDGARVPCEFPLPEPPEGQELDVDSVRVVYHSPGAPPATFSRTPAAAVCEPGEFYIQDEVIQLCPGSCDLVEADEDARVDISFDCLADVR